MYFVQSLALLVYFAIGVQSHVPIARYVRQSDNLSVALAPVVGKATQVKATITNNGADDLSLLKIGTLLDERPVEKVKLVDEKGDIVPFMGIRLSLYYEGLQTKDFQKLSSGSSVSQTIDLSTMYDLKPQTYSVHAQGSIASIVGKSQEPRSISFKSDPISIKIDNASSAAVNQKAFKRTIIEDDSCTTEQLKATREGVQNCGTLARAAAADASNAQSSRFVEYFKSNDTKTREHVTGRLLAVAQECATSDSGNTRVLCKDEFDYCESDGPLIAYTVWVNGYVTLCPLFYETRPPLPEACHKQDHATTLIHEMTHARAVYEQEVSTQDYAYGYENSTALDALSCLYNADQYSLYANGK
ncbi:metallo ase [Fusarium longipes]|uniref:Neutral protease 2 n=1 Tax=Fusarium longipes TaxID=694270 RepID=A0A395TB18_9HYPO|nr:metallo ase [Fusarium longipes]